MAFSIKGNTIEIACIEEIINVLIPSDELEEFVGNHNFSREEVIKFANKIGVDCGIVVGRLQNDRYINHDTLNGLKKQYVM